MVRFHPSQALQKYRRETGILAKLVVVGMTANEFSIADPNDRGMMDVVGFDSSVPEIMRQFAIDTI
jgi:60 kDa SS-A/Ro ribonucleoprotein